MLDVWVDLYNGLVARRAVTGVADFPRSYFQAVAADPTFVTFAARAEDKVLAMAIWFTHRGAVYNHLGASSDAGYAVGASYALYDA